MDELLEVLIEFWLESLDQVWRVLNEFELSESFKQKPYSVLIKFLKVSESLKWDLKSLKVLEFYTSTEELKRAKKFWIGQENFLNIFIMSSRALMKSREVLKSLERVLNDLDKSSTSWNEPWRVLNEFQGFLSK